MKNIIRQIKIEIIGWFAFLMCYYSMLDGSNKPLLSNLALIIALSAPILHNFYGYHLARYPGNAPTVKASLEAYLRRMRRFMIQSIISRIIFVCGLMIFFASDIYLTPSKVFLFAALTLTLILIQAIFLYKIWTKRIAGIRLTLSGFA